MVEMVHQVDTNQVEAAAVLPQLEQLGKLGPVQVVKVVMELHLQSMVLS